MRSLSVYFAITLISLTSFCAYGNTNQVKVYTTTNDKSLAMHPEILTLKNNRKIASDKGCIIIEPSVRYQEMFGFGAAMTGSSCYNLLKMSPENRRKLLVETFDPLKGDGFSYIRLSIGCSDFSMDEYTYCDTPGIENFAIHEYDKRDIFPVLKEILAINPDVKILGSPWTCPKWMKVNNLKELKPFDSWTSGQLNPACYQDYAAYFVKYIQAMEAEGFKIDAITIQNEPLYRGNSASLYMTWQEQRDFIKYALGPAFEKDGIRTNIVVFDHNYSYDQEREENAGQYGYPLRIYEDPAAARYVDGAAYHPYGGKKEELTRVHNERPDKNLYFTEMSIALWKDEDIADDDQTGRKYGKSLMWNMREIGLGTINNYNQVILMWNFMLDDKHGPYRFEGFNKLLGIINIDSKDYKTYSKHSLYYTVAHLSKVIQPGAFRIKSESNNIENIHYAAFENPDNTYALIIQNEKDEAQSISVKIGNRSFFHSIPAKSVNSYLWKK